MTAEIGFADLLRAWDALGRSPGALAPLGQLFGLSVQRTPESISRPPSKPPLHEPLPMVREPSPVRTANAVGDAVSLSSTGIALEPLPPAPPPVPVWLTAAPLPAPASISAPGIPLPPLFAPERERALLSSAARTLRSDGDIDVDAWVEAAARLLLPRWLPRQRIASLRGGVQLIIDQSAWMMPFAQDVHRVVARLRAVVGGVLQEQRVRELPPNIYTSTTNSVERWVPPLPGTAIMIVSDLGRAALQCGRLGPRMAWQGFLRALETANFESVVLVPGRASQYIDIEHNPHRTLLLDWDRSARVSELTKFRKGRRK